MVRLLAGVGGLLLVVGLALIAGTMSGLVLAFGSEVPVAPALLGFAAFLVGTVLLLAGAAMWVACITVVMFVPNPPEEPRPG